MQIYEFIIVGAGATGCVLANRLSEDPNCSVLLIEAGGSDSSFKIQMPRAFAKAFEDPKLVYVYPASRPGRNEPEYWFRGKALGGSTTVNGLLYTRGFRKDYDEWATAGCPGWGWSDMAPCFRAVEGNTLGPAEWRGHDGPYKVMEHLGRTELNEAVITAATQMGVPRRIDFNESDDEGFGYNQHSVGGGRRTTAAKAFLYPLKERRNLTILSETEVERVTFDGRQVRGVIVRSPAGARELRARDVILCAGAIETPKLLMLSGIGPEDQLRAAGLEVLNAAPQVGQNMREHLLLTLQFRVSHGSSNHEMVSPRLLWNVLRWQFLRSGPLTYGATEFGGFVKIRPQSDRPDGQLMGAPLSVDKDVPGFAIERKPGFALGGYVVRPQGRGELRLQSPDPAMPPALTPNFLGDAADQEIAIGLVRWIRELAKQTALGPFAASETFPGPDYSTDEQILDGYNRFGTCGHHTIGTCRMGSDPQSVLDPRLRVRGVEGLRVADISAMPSMPSGNTQAPALAFAWRASQLILEDRAAAGIAA